MNQNDTAYTMTIYGVIAGKEYLIDRFSCMHWLYLWANTPVDQYADPTMPIVTGYRLPTAYPGIVIDFEEGVKADNAMSRLGNLQIDSYVLPIVSDPGAIQEKRITKTAQNLFEFLSTFCQYLSGGAEYVDHVDTDGNETRSMPLPLMDNRLVIHRRGLIEKLLGSLGLAFVSVESITRDEPFLPNTVVTYVVPKYSRFRFGHY